MSAERFPDRPAPPHAEHGPPAVSETDARSGPGGGSGAPAPEHVDVLIVGAGISGIGAAYHLSEQCPGTTFVVLDSLASYGGTWLTHRYPGIRSDSDLYTYGYRFKPWTGAPIASAAEILKYMGEVIAENGLDRHVRYHHRVDAARWSTPEHRWTIEVTRTDTAEQVRFTAGFLWMCQGYYRHAHGYTPRWEGVERFKGPVVHPQAWPADLDYRGKQVIVIGSGATAATLIPAIADDCAHVTLLQRSPTYFFARRNVNELADMLRELDVPEAWVHEIVRRKLVHDQAVFTRRAFEEPGTVKQELLAGVSAFIGPEATAAHFTPTYRPWRQRIAVVPDGDLFRQIAAGKVAVVTDHIERFTETGICVRSGRVLEADVIITATGLTLNVLGDIDVVIDGEPLDFARTVTYRGMMFTGVPNMVWVFGYFRYSWTLRADLVADFVCRVLTHMRQRRARQVSVALRAQDRDMPLSSWIDPEDFNPGYVMRGLHLLPRRGDRPEWQHTQDYWTERTQLPAIDLDDEAFVYA